MKVLNRFSGSLTEHLLKHTRSDATAGQDSGVEDVTVCDLLLCADVKLLPIVCRLWLMFIEQRIDFPLWPLGVMSHRALMRARMFVVFQAALFALNHRLGSIAAEQTLTWTCHRAPCSFNQLGSYRWLPVLKLNLSGGSVEC